MKTLVKIFLGFFLLIIILVVLVLGYFGFVPGVSSLFGSNKPRDLGIKYDKASLASVQVKSQVVYDILPAETPPENSRQFSGSRPITAEFSSAEITAIMNNSPWRYWPYHNLQVKFNADGSGEISGTLIKDKLPGYGAMIGVPKEAIEFAMKILPANPVFYVKGKGALTANKVSLFEPQKFEIGRTPLPVEMFLSMMPASLVKEAYALNIGGMSEELGKVKNKKALIIDYINSRLETFTGFYAKKAYFSENKVVFEGTLPEKKSVVQ